MPVDNGSPAARRGATPPGGVSTIDLFSWSEGPDTTRSPAVVRHSATNDSNAFLHAADQSSCDSPVGRPTIRMHQPAGGVSTITFGEQLSAEEADALLKRRPGSDLKKREMYGSGIFNGSGSGNGDGNGAHADRTTVRMHQHQEAPRSRTQSDAKHKELNGSKIFGQARCRPTSDAKARELNGSNIFNSPNHEYRAPTPRMVTEPEEQRYPPHDPQQNTPAGGVSQISFGGEECTSPKKPVTIPEVAKQKELSGTVETTDDLTARRSFSNAKAKELVGSNIFGPPPPDSPKPPRSHEVRDETRARASEAAQPRNVHTSVKVSNPAGGRSQISFATKEDIDGISHRMHELKNAELSGHDIFSEGSNPANDKSQHHHLSKAKLKEMSGSDIFSDDKPRARDTIGGIRKPPGGGSTIALV